LSIEQVLACMAEAGVAKQKYPERLVIVDALPRTASGKVRKDQLRKDIRERLAAPTP
jgi:non-ribosomal peptide synthetase component E (peptide arylation enzyme)